MWFFLHVISFSYDDADRKQRRCYEGFFRSLCGVLPCRACRVKYKKNYTSLFTNRVLDSRDNLVKFVYDLHDRVNVETSNTTHVRCCTLDSVTGFYKGLRGRYEPMLVLDGDGDGGGCRRTGGHCRRDRVRMAPAHNYCDNKTDAAAGYDVWGSAMWFFLHIVSFNYPEDPPARRRANHDVFLTFLSRVVPCPLLRELLGRRPPASTKNRDSLSRFVHKARAMRNGKSAAPSYDDVKSLYGVRLQSR